MKALASSMGIVLAGLGVCWFTVAGANAQRATGTGNASKNALHRLSDVLPARLAEYVRRSGGDRALSEMSAEQVQNLVDGTIDTRLMIAVLRPKGYVKFEGSATLATDVGAAATTDGAESAPALLIAASKAMLADGTEVAWGDPLPLGTVIQNGMILNAGEVPVRIVTEPATYILQPGALAGGACQKGCSTTCKPSYYACCRSDNNGCVYCHCVRDSAEAGCDLGGGEGSSACATQ